MLIRLTDLSGKAPDEDASNWDQVPPRGRGGEGREDSTTGLDSARERTRAQAQYKGLLAAEVRSAGNGAGRQADLEGETGGAT